MINLNQDLVLKYLSRLPKIETSEKPVFIFLHGVGSNERDLFSLESFLPENFTVISARSPYRLGFDSYSFYDIDYSSGTKVINAEQAEKSRNTLKKFITQIIEKYKIDSDKVYLGGFSQGAIMSFSVSLTFPGMVKAITSFSGSILNEIKPLVNPNDEIKKIQVFMSHGIHDNVLPINLAREAKDYLFSLGIIPDYNEFNGGHEIPSSIINSFNSWIKKITVK
ncbi:MAG: esterase [Cyanobacteriota bacterium]